MAKNHESKLRIEDLTDTKIYAAIRYLEPDAESANQQNDDVEFATFVTSVILLLGCLGFLCLSVEIGSLILVFADS